MVPQHVNDVVARVVAWHNRHPLAWRIGPDHVASVGLVALPFHWVCPLAPPASPLASTPVAGTPVESVDLPLGTITPQAAAAARSADSIEDLSAVDTVPMAAQWMQATQGALEGRVQIEAAVLGCARRRAPSRAAQRAAALVARLRRKPVLPLMLLDRAWSDDFIAPLTPEQVTAWALAHAWTEPVGDIDWPVRSIDVDPALDAPAWPGGHETSLTTLWLVTAAVEFGGHRLRLLIGRGRGGRWEVLGPRALSGPRLAGSAAGLALAGALGTVAVIRPAWLHEAPAAVMARLGGGSTAAPAEAASAPAHGAEPYEEVLTDDRQAAAAEAHGEPGAPPSGAPGAPAGAAGAAGAAGDAGVAADDPVRRHAELDPGADLRRRRAAAHAAARLGSPVAAASAVRGRPPATPSAAVPEAGPGLDDDIAPPPRLVHIRPEISDATRHDARVASALLRGEDPNAPPPRAQGGVRGAGKAGAKPGAADPAGTLYALVMRRTDTRLESEALLGTLRTVAARADTRLPTRQDVMESDRGFQATWWPFASRDEAERAKRQLAARGLQLEIVDF